MRLLLIRHAQTPANVAGVIQTLPPGPGLTARGLRQAEELQHALSSDPVDGIYVSTLVRTHATAAPLAADRGREVIELPGLREIEAGELEDRADRDSIQRYLATAFAWGMGQLDGAMPGAENGHSFFARFDDAISRVWDDVNGQAGTATDQDVADPTAVVISHGAAIRVWLAGRARNVPPTFAGDNELDNTGLVELEGSPAEGWTLLSWQGSPVGGSALADPSADDPTGDVVRA